MASHDAAFVLQLPLAASRAACLSATNGPGWRVTGEQAAPHLRRL